MTSSTNSLKSERKEDLRRAVIDPAFHREKFCQRSLFWPQVEAVKLVEKHVDERNSKILTIRSARQTMKNEVSAFIEARLLMKFHRVGGTIVKAAPTYRPQIVNSKRRLEQAIAQDPLISPKPRAYREGYIKEYGKASVEFLSGEKHSNVEGATASLLLEIDEAHKIDKGKFEESFAPMTASTAAPTVMYGVAAAKCDLLYEQRIFNEEHDPKLNLQFPASIWCEINPSYAKHYEERRNKLGAGHPIILTQYDLIDVDAAGGFFSKWQVDGILSGDHDRAGQRTNQRFIGAVIDIAGESEEGEDLTEERGDSSRDQTTLLIFDVDWTKAKNDIPLFRLLDIDIWVGKALAEGPSGLPGQQEILLNKLRQWHVDKAVVDGRGVGEQISSYLSKRHSGVEVYKADVDTVSDDCYALLAIVNNDQLKAFKPNGSFEYEELKKQIGHVATKVNRHDKLKMVKPNGDKSKHIDVPKAMSYAHRLLDHYIIGVAE